MTDWIETELKLGLRGEHAWQRLRDRLGPGRIANQTNHFFDLPERPFRAARIGVRLRREDDARILTVKGAADPASSVIKRRIELESDVDVEVFDRCLAAGLDLRPWVAQWRRRVAADPEIETFLERLETLAKDQLLRPFGRFTNRRETCRLELSDPDGPFEIELEIDRTEYPGGRVDYEIEVELKQARDGLRSADTPIERTHRALVLWLENEIGIQTFAVESKLARLNEILEAEALRLAASP